MSAQLDALNLKVQRILTDRFGTVQIDGDGDYTLRYESARVFVGCSEWGENTVVRVFAPVLFGVPPTPELYEYVATEGGNYILGGLCARPGDGGVTLEFRYTVLGDFLDAEELAQAVMAVIFTANGLDDKLKPRFGGSRFHEDD